jgi:hypothetical protein
MRHEQSQMHDKTQVAEMAMELATQQQREFEKQTAILLDIEQQEEGTIMGNSGAVDFVDGEGALHGSPEILIEQKARLENERSRTEMLQARREQVTRDQQRQQQQRAFELDTQRHVLVVERERTLELEKQVFLRNSLGLEPGEPVPVRTAMPQPQAMHGMGVVRGGSSPLIQTPVPASTAMQYTHMDTPFPVVTSGQDMLDMRSKMRILEEQLQVHSLPLYFSCLPSNLRVALAQVDDHYDPNQSVHLILYDLFSSDSCELLRWKQTTAAAARLPVPSLRRAPPTKHTQ